MSSFPHPGWGTRGSPGVPGSTRHPLKAYRWKVRAGLGLCAGFVSELEKFA